MEEKKSISNFKIVGIAVLVVLALWPRFVTLDSRPLMHDESMFAWYAYDHMVQSRDINSATGKPGHYIHLPILHGPTMMLAVGELFKVFGDSILVARALIAVCSCLAMAAGLSLLPRRYRWWFAPLFLTSPIILYYSRFLRDEMIFNACLLVGLAAANRAFSRCRWAAAWAALSATCILFLWAIMENALFAWATVVTFLALWWLRMILWKNPAWSLRPLRPIRIQTTTPAPKKIGPHRLHREGSYIDRSFDQLTTPGAGKMETTGGEGTSNATASVSIPPRNAERRRFIQLAIGWSGGLVIGTALILCIFGYTTPASYWAEWKNPTPEMKAKDDSILGWIAAYPPIRNQVESWTYWEGQHKEHRIKGALHYHLPILMTYELPVLIMLAIGIAWDSVLRRWRFLVYASVIGGWIVLWLIWRSLEAKFGTMGPLQPILNFCHLAANRSSLMLGLWIFPLLVWGLFALKEHRVLASFLAYWAACSLFQYSIAGEKVPWLAVHIAIPLNLLVCWVWAPRLMRMGSTGRTAIACFALLATFVSLRNDYHLIYDRAADPSERLVFNHTSTRIHRFMLAKLHTWEEEQLRAEDLRAGVENAAPGIKIKDRNVYFAGAPGWPGTWYFRHCAYHFTLPGPTDPPEKIDLVMSDQGTGEAYAQSLDKDDWNLQEMPLRVAWLNPMPEDQLISQYLYPEESWMPWGEWIDYWTTEKVWLDLWNYYWFRETWTPTGPYPITVIDPLRARR